MSLEHVYEEMLGLDEGPTAEEIQEQEKVAEEVAEETVKLAQDYDTAGRDLAHVYANNWLAKHGAEAFAGRETSEEEAAEEKAKKKKAEKKDGEDEDEEEEESAEEKKASYLACAQADPEFANMLLEYRAATDPLEKAAMLGNITSKAKEIASAIGGHASNVAGKVKHHATRAGHAVAEHAQRGAHAAREHAKPLGVGAAIGGGLGFGGGRASKRGQ